MNQLKESEQPTEPTLKFYFYRIYCKDVDVHDCYIGRTTRWEARISNHKMKSNDSDLKLYKCISENGGFSNWVCECIHTEVCTETAASFIEYSFFKLFEPTLNTRVPRMKLNVFQSKKVENNRTYCQAHYAIKTTCDCGWIGSKMSLAHHLKSKKHQIWLENEELKEIVYADMIDLTNQTSAFEYACCLNCKSKYGV
jgi:hypothetical protein